MIGENNIYVGGSITEDEKVKVNEKSQECHSGQKLLWRMLQFNYTVIINCKCSINTEHSGPRCRCNTFKYLIQEREVKFPREIIASTTCS